LEAGVNRRDFAHGWVGEELLDYLGKLGLQKTGLPKG